MSKYHPRSAIAQYQIKLGKKSDEYVVSRFDRRQLIWWNNKNPNFTESFTTHLEAFEAIVVMAQNEEEYAMGMEAQGEERWQC